MSLALWDMALSKFPLRQKSVSADRPPFSPLCRAVAVGCIVTIEQDTVHLVLRASFRSGDLLPISLSSVQVGKRFTPRLHNIQGRKVPHLREGRSLAPGRLDHHALHCTIDDPHKVVHLNQNPASWPRNSAKSPTSSTPYLAHSRMVLHSNLHRAPAHSRRARRGHRLSRFRKCPAQKLGDPDSQAFVPVLLPPVRTDHLDLIELGSEFAVADPIAVLVGSHKRNPNPRAAGRVAEAHSAVLFQVAAHSGRPSIERSRRTWFLSRRWLLKCTRSIAQLP